jgi:hypothetical protein
MPILNYTTSTPVDRTVGQVQRILITAGARRFGIDYDDDGLPVAFSFLIRTRWGDRGFVLPVDVDAVFAVLTRQYSAGKMKQAHVGKPTRDQAARVGWRILKDWVEAQMAIIETEMVTLDQVLLPYLTVETGKSLYQIMTERQLALPAPSEG